MPDIERTLSQEQNEYSINVDDINYTIEIKPQKKFEIQLNEQGPQGPRGFTGNGIESIIKTSSNGLVDTYTITFTDGDTTTFDVTNGNGIDYIELTSEQDLTKTYTIYFDNGDTETFEVTDGYSPTATVEKEGTRATITITDINGTTTADIYDGEGNVDDVRVNGSSVVNAGIATITVPTDNTELTNGAGYITGIDSTDVTTALGYTPSDNDLSNLSSTGQGILDNKLNQQQTTNCILEVPNKIKYTLENGALTLLAGSEVVVPYGTTDLSSTYPTGSTFINENIQVVDTEYSDGKFFVRVKTLTDVTRAMQAGSSTLAPKMLTLQMQENSIGILSYGGASGNVTVTSDSDAGNVLFYNSTTNNIKGKSSGTINYPVCSFPIFSAINNETYYIASITNVFQCFGYIGTTLWCDKGVRCLISNGFNDDGSQNNADVTTTSIQILQYDTTSSTGNKFLYIQKTGTLATASKGNITSATVTSSTNSCIIAGFYWDGTYITGFGCFQALNTKYLTDGNVVASYLTLADSVTAPTSTPITYDLTGYLPKDNYEYDVLVSGIIYTGATSGNFTRINLYSDRVGSSCYFIQTQTRVNYQLGACNTTWFPIGSGRKLVVTGNADNNGRFFLYLRGYRRRGINL